MNTLLEEGQRRGLGGRGREALRRAIAGQLNVLRLAWNEGETPAVDEGFWQQVAAQIEVVPALSLRQALNATGVVLHTNLGRAPWPPEAVAAAASVAGAAVLEIDPVSGGRGRREGAVSALLAEITGAAAGLAVNNNAAALLLAVAALSRGQGVVLARTEMVEIGGSYRMPEVVRAAGGRLIGIGTTNRVHLSDFEQALRDNEVGCVLRVHRSNFEQHGFVGEPTTAALAALCQQYGIPLVHDLGSGVIGGVEGAAVANEPTVQESLEAGVPVVTFSGDKLLGGPQAGLLVGEKPLIEKIRRDMLTRCLRLDKTLLAALEAVLRLHRLGPDAARESLPALRRLALQAAALAPRAEALVKALSLPELNLDLEVVATAGKVGSGASPVPVIEGRGVALRPAGATATALAARLRLGVPAVFARVQDDAVVLDLRTIDPSEDSLLATAVIAAVQAL